MIGHKNGRLETLQQRLFPDIAFRVVDEHTGVHIAVGIDMQERRPLAMQPPTYFVSFWKSMAKSGFSARYLWMQ